MTIEKKGRRSKSRATKIVARGRRVGQPRPSVALSRSSHVTPAGGNVFADLGFPPDEAANLKLRAQLMMELRVAIAGLPQDKAASLLGVSQPRISHLVHGRIGFFTIDTLVNMLAHAGVSTHVSIKRRPRSAGWTSP